MSFHLQTCRLSHFHLSVSCRISTRVQCSHEYPPQTSAIMNEKEVSAVGLEKANTVDVGDIPTEIIKHANDADEAMKAFQGHEGEVIVLDEATNRRLLRRIDLNLMPVRRC